MARDYFIVEHEGHISPVPDQVLLKDEPDFKRFTNCFGGLGRLGRQNPDARRSMIAAVQSEATGKPQPDASIDVMNEAGVDVCMLVPHWHAQHMNMEHKGTPNDWVIEACEKFPDRLLPGPVFRPSVVGVWETLREMEYLVAEKGVRYCKIYPPGEAWAMSDERYFPVYALAQELGLTLAFHTGHSFVYGADADHSHPRHLEKVCRNFYDLKVLAFHFGWPWTQELNVLAGAYPNLHIGMSFLNGTVKNRPRMFEKLLGDALLWAGVDKVHYSNDALHNIGMHIEDFRNFQFSERIQEDYGYTPLTTEDKAKIFGINFARLIGIEPRKRVD